MSDFSEASFFFGNVDDNGQLENADIDPEIVGVLQSFSTALANDFTLDKIGAPAGGHRVIRTEDYDGPIPECIFEGGILRFTDLFAPSNQCFRRVGNRLRFRRPITRPPAKIIECKDTDEAERFLMPDDPMSRDADMPAHRRMSPTEEEEEEGDTSPQSTPWIDQVQPCEECEPTPPTAPSLSISFRLPAPASARVPSKDSTLKLMWSTEAPRFSAVHHAPWDAPSAWDVRPKEEVTAALEEEDTEEPPPTLPPSTSTSTSTSDSSATTDAEAPAQPSSPRRFTGLQLQPPPRLPRKPAPFTLADAEIQGPPAAPGSDEAEGHKPRWGALRRPRGSRRASPAPKDKSGERAPGQGAPKVAKQGQGSKAVVPENDPLAPLLGAVKLDQVDPFLVPSNPDLARGAWLDDLLRDLASLSSPSTSASASAPASTSPPHLLSSPSTSASTSPPPLLSSPSTSAPASTTPPPLLPPLPPPRPTALRKARVLLDMNDPRMLLDTVQPPPPQPARSTVESQAAKGPHAGGTDLGLDAAAEKEMEQFLCTEEEVARREEREQAEVEPPRRVRPILMGTKEADELLAKRTEEELAPLDEEPLPEARPDQPLPPNFGIMGALGQFGSGLGLGAGLGLGSPFGFGGMAGLSPFPSGLPSFLQNSSLLSTLGMAGMGFPGGSSVPGLNSSGAMPPLSPAPNQPNGSSASQSASQSGGGVPSQPTAQNDRFSLETGNLYGGGEGGGLGDPDSLGLPSMPDLGSGTSTTQLAEQQQKQQQQLLKFDRRVRERLGQTVVQHSKPAVTLRTMYTELSFARLEHFHRPRADAHTLRPGHPHVFQVLPPKKPRKRRHGRHKGKTVRADKNGQPVVIDHSKRRKGKQPDESGSDNGPSDIEDDEFFNPLDVLRRPSDLSANDGRIALMEFIEEHPLLIQNPGMASRLQYFYRKLNETDPTDPLLDEGECIILGAKDDSPFLGDIDPGTAVGSLMNNLYKAPVFAHPPRQTDFLLVWPRDARQHPTVRPIQRTYAVGQIHPHLEVPAPNSRAAATFIKMRLSAYIHRAFKVKENRGRIRIGNITRAFPSMSENSIRKRLKECADFQRGGDESGCWILRPDVRLRTGDELRDMVTPEMICAYESMLAGQHRLQAAGLEEAQQRTKGHGHSTDVQRLATYVNDILAMTPWSLTANFLSAMQGKGTLQLTGIGDPTGRGEGFSYILQGNKNPIKDREQTAAKNNTPGPATVMGTDADLRKLSLDNARQVLLNYGVPEHEIQRLSRWDRIDLVRKLSSEAVARGDESAAAKFARGSRPTPKQQAVQQKEQCQRIFEQHMRCLAAESVTERHDDADLFSASEDDESDFDEFGRDLEDELQQSSAQQEVDEEVDRKEYEDFMKQQHGGGDVGVYDPMTGTYTTAAWPSINPATGRPFASGPSGTAPGATSTSAYHGTAGYKPPGSTAPVPLTAPPPAPHSKAAKERAGAEIIGAEPSPTVPEQVDTSDGVRASTETETEELEGSNEGDEMEGEEGEEGAKIDSKKAAKYLRQQGPKLHISRATLGIQSAPHHARKIVDIISMNEQGQFVEPGGPRGLFTIGAYSDGHAGAPPSSGRPSVRRKKMVIKKTTYETLPNGDVKVSTTYIRDQAMINIFVKREKQTDSRKMNRLPVEEERRRLEKRRERRRIQEQLRRVRRSLARQKKERELILSNPNDGTYLGTDKRPVAKTAKKGKGKRPRVLRRAVELTPGVKPEGGASPTDAAPDEGGLPAPDPEHPDVPVTCQLKCSACGMIGHIRTNRCCPKYSQTQEMKGLCTDNIVKVEGTRLKIDAKKVKDVLRIRLPRDGEDFENFDEMRLRLNERRKRGSAPEIQLSNILSSVWDTIAALPEADLFLKPVPAKHAPGYYDIIANPIDLGKIRDKIRLFKYMSRRQFLADIQLIANNAHKYNEGRYDHIPPLADRLLEFTKEELEKLGEQCAPFEDKLVAVEREEMEAQRRIQEKREREREEKRRRQERERQIREEARCAEAKRKREREEQRALLELIKADKRAKKQKEEEARRAEAERKRQEELERLRKEEEGRQRQEELRRQEAERKRLEEEEKVRQAEAERQRIALEEEARRIAEEQEILRQYEAERALAKQQKRERKEKRRAARAARAAAQLGAELAAKEPSGGRPMSLKISLSRRKRPAEEAPQPAGCETPEAPPGEDTERKHHRHRRHKHRHGGGKHKRRRQADAGDTSEEDLLVDIGGGSSSSSAGVAGSLPKIKLRPLAPSASPSTPMSPAPAPAHAPHPGAASPGSPPPGYPVPRGISLLGLQASQEGEDTDEELDIGSLDDI